MKESIVQMLPALWTAIGIPLMTWLGAQLVVLLNSKIKGTKWEQGVAKFESMVATIVQHAEAELRPDIEEALRDGKLTPEEQASLKAKVMALVQKEVVPLVPEMLKGFSQPMIDMLISGTIERAVAAMKLPDPVVVAAAAGAAARSAVKTLEDADRVPLVTLPVPP